MPVHRYKSVSEMVSYPQGTSLSQSKKTLSNYLLLFSEIVYSGMGIVHKNANVSSCETDSAEETKFPQGKEIWGTKKKEGNTSFSSTSKNHEIYPVHSHAAIACLNIVSRHTGSYIYI